MAASHASIPIALRRSRGPESSDHHIKHMRYIWFKWHDRMAYLTPRGDKRSAGSSSKVDTARSRSDHPLTWSSIGRSRRFVEELHDRGPIEPRSRRNQAAITARSSRDHASFFVESSPRALIGIDWGLRSRFTHDLLTIVARSRRDRGPMVVLFGSEMEAELLRNWSHNLCQWNRPLEAIQPLPRLPQLPTILGLIFPLKTHVFSLCSSTFDRFVKELSKFRGRSVVHRDPPAFRLDCEAIWARLIANFSLISSNFPLEFRTCARKNPSKFASIHKN